MRLPLFLFMGLFGQVLPAQMNHDHLPSAEARAALPPDGGPQYNRLVFEASPYLQQHAANPVDWYPWGEEAFARAVRENKPIFLSIGYATCHWCHVMARESFQDAEVAALLARDFIAVKVDREERPDVDDIYMTACRVTNGECGWPLTAVLTPDRRPFFVGSYFPKTGAHGRPGLMELLPRIAEAWKGRRDTLEAAAATLTDTLRTHAETAIGMPPGLNVVQGTARELMGFYDRKYGGFGTDAKFPMPQNLIFLMRYHARTGDKAALDAVLHTLHRMRAGGLYDHVGSGFHRYTVDRAWAVPHFEKMLYDQAMLTLAYLEAYQLTGEVRWADTARGILAYVTREMTAPGGGFYAAQDAESEGVEGKYYLWTAEEVVAVLGAKDGALFNRAYGVTAAGNFKDAGPGLNIPRLSEDPKEIAQALHTTPEALEARLADMRVKLLARRSARVAPFKDDKILTGWNGLMIAAFARASWVLHEPGYRDVAQKALTYVLTDLRAPDGTLYKRARAGNVGLTAHLDDYAFVVWGLLELYRAGFEVDHLAEAVRLCGDAANRFWDGAHGGFFLTAHDADPLIVRGKPSGDAALPSGNSVMAWNLAVLARLTTNEVFADLADKQFRTFAKALAEFPADAPFMALAVDFEEGPGHEVVLVGDPADAEMKTLIAALNRAYLPRSVVLLRPTGDEKLPAIAPFVAAYAPRNNQATAFVCRNFSCTQPTGDPEQMLRDLGAAPSP